MFDIKNHVKDRTVSFVKAYAGNLWYATELGLEFPVPFGDMVEATFLATDRAMLFMRYIRKHVGSESPARAPDAGDPAFGRTVRFTNARAGNLWFVAQDGFEFAVPFAAAAEGVIRATENEEVLASFLRAHRERAEQGRRVAAGC